MTINRRDFLKICLQTAPAAAIASSFNFPWPQEQNNRPFAAPWRVSREEGYLVDDEWIAKDWPTIREYSSYDVLSIHEKAQLLLDHYGYDDEMLADEYSIVRVGKRWNQADLSVFESEFGDLLDEDVDPDNLGFDELLSYGPYRAGKVIMEHLPRFECKRLGLYLVEGEYPGSSFCGVSYKGDLNILNRTLSRYGLNMIVYEPSESDQPA